MQIFNWPDFSSSFMTIGFRRSSVSVARPQASSGTSDQRQQILFARGKLNDLQKALRTIDSSWRTTRSSYELTAAGTRSSADLGLGDPTSAYLESTDEVNATPTSFETHGPAWTGVSTAAAIIDGEYDGSNGTGTLTFKVNKAGIKGEDNLRLDVFRPDGTKIESIDIRSGHDPDRIYTLSSGLELTLGDGELAKKDEFYLEVYAATGSVADPDRAFNGTGVADANLEYGLDVTAGSFAINGATITVADDDSINSVLAKINDSAAGVTATYSAATEMVTLVHDTPGASGEITLSNDTSGFLVTTKLSGAAAVPGQDDGLDTLLKDVDRFAGTTAGDVFINGIAIAIDPDQDSLQDVIDRINASAAGATASMDATGRYFSLTADDTAADLTVDDNGRGLFPALEITAGVFDPLETGGIGLRVSRDRADRISGAVRDAAKAINALFGIAVPGQEAGSWLQMVRTNLKNDITGILEAKGESEFSDIGLEVDWRATGGRVIRFSGQDQVTLASAVARHPNSVHSLLFADVSNLDSGFVDGLMATAEAAQTALEQALGYKGRLVDTYA